MLERSNRVASRASGLVPSQVRFLLSASLFLISSKNTLVRLCTANVVLSSIFPGLIRNNIFLICYKLVLKHGKSWFVSYSPHLFSL